MSRTPEEIDELREIQVRSDIKDIVATPVGVRFFKYLVDKGKVFTSVFHGNSLDAFNTGHRAFALDILDILFEVAPEKVPTIILEDKEMIQAQREAQESAEDEGEELY